MSTLRNALLLLTVVAGSTLNGCYATVQSEPAYVEADAVPADIEVYPHTYYEGRVVYFVNDRWYYRDGPHWAYYRSEPEPLHRQRTYVQQAPPARRVYQAPQRRQYLAAPPPAPRERLNAPPARRYEAEPRAERRE